MLMDGRMTQRCRLRVELDLHVMSKRALRLWSNQLLHPVLSPFQIFSSTPRCLHRLHWAGPWQPVVLCGPRANKWQPPLGSSITLLHTCTSMAGRGAIKHPWLSRDTGRSAEAPLSTQDSYESIVTVCVCVYVDVCVCKAVLLAHALSTLWLYISVILGLILIQTSALTIFPKETLHCPGFTGDIISLDIFLCLSDTPPPHTHTHTHT